MNIGGQEKFKVFDNKALQASTYIKRRKGYR